MTRYSLGRRLGGLQF